MSNPTYVAHQEVMAAGKDIQSQEVAVISLGTGKAENIGRSLRKTTASLLSEDGHRQMILSSVNGEVFPYFRLDVPQGLETIKLDEWKEPSRRSTENTFNKIKRLTNVYLARPDVTKMMQEAAQLLIKQRPLRSSTRSQEGARQPLENTKSPSVVVPSEREEKDSPLFVVPSQRNKKFVGRGDILGAIKRDMSHGSRLALSGLAGIGWVCHKYIKFIKLTADLSKSAIGLEYLYREQDHVKHILWISMANTQSLHIALRRIAQSLSLPAAESVNDIPHLLIQRLKTTNSKPSPSILVLDDVSDSVRGVMRSFVDRFVQEVAGSVLALTRDNEVGSGFADPEKSYVVKPMDKLSAVTLFRSSISRYFNLDAEDTNDIVDVVRSFEGIPLAIEQAAAYMSAAFVRPGEYLKMFRDPRGQGELLDPRSSAFRGPSVFERIVQTVHELHHTTQDLLALMAFLGHSAIPKSLLRAIDEPSFEYHDAVHELQSYALISVDTLEGTYSMNNVVRIAMRQDAIGANTATTLEERALAVVEANFPAGQFDTWRDCELLMPHALTVTRYAPQGHEAKSQRATLLHKASNYASLRVTFDGFSLDILPDLCQTAFHTCEELLGSEHSVTLDCATTWAKVVHLQGHFHRAKELLSRALTITEKKYGRENSIYMDRLHILANFNRDQAYYNDGPYDEAVELYWEIVSWDKRNLGSEHLTSIARRMDLNLVLCAQAKARESQSEAEEAIETSRGTLQILMNSMESERPVPATLFRVRELARMCRLEGRTSECLSLLEEALSLRGLSKDTVAGAALLHELALLQFCSEEFEKAAATCKEALRTTAMELLRQTPWALEMMCTLGSILMKLERYLEANGLFREANEGLLEIFGPRHRLTTQYLAESEVALEKSREPQQGVLKLSEKITEVTTSRGDQMQALTRSKGQSKTPLRPVSVPASIINPGKQSAISPSSKAQTVSGLGFGENSKGALSAKDRSNAKIIGTSKENFNNLTAYFFLENVLPAHHIPDMLGRLVIDRSEPLRSFIPFSDDSSVTFNPKDIVPGIEDRPIIYSEFSSQFQWTKSNTTRVIALGLFCIGFRKIPLRETSVEALEVRQYNMLGIAQSANTLLHDARYHHQILKMVRDTRKSTVYMVTNMLTARDLSIHESRSRGSFASREKHVQIKNEEVIFALGYRKIKISRGNWNRRIWWNRGSDSESQLRLKLDA